MDAKSSASEPQRPMRTAARRRGSSEANTHPSARRRRSSARRTHAFRTTDPDQRAVRRSRAIAPAIGEQPVQVIDPHETRSRSELLDCPAQPNRAERVSLGDRASGEVGDDRLESQIARRTWGDWIRTLAPAAVNRDLFPAGLSIGAKAAE